MYINGMLSMARKYNIKPGQLWGLGRKTDHDIWLYLVIKVSDGIVKFITLSKESGIRYHPGKVTEDDLDSIYQVDSLWHRIL